MAKTTKDTTANGTGANVGFEAKLWQAADALRNNMDAAEHDRDRNPDAVSREARPDHAQPRIATPIAT